MTFLCLFMAALIAPILSLPDFTQSTAKFAANTLIRTEYFGSDDCQITDGCVKAAGERVIIRFDQWVINIGSDWVFGNPEDLETTNITKYDECYQISDIVDFSTFEVYKTDDTSKAILSTGFGQGLCVQDGFQLGTDDWIEAGFPSDTTANASVSNGCRSQGIAFGRVDFVRNHIPCQFVDITGLTAGNYTLRSTVNPTGNLDEIDSTNNAVEQTFYYSGNPDDYFVSSYTPNNTDFNYWLTARNSLLSAGIGQPSTEYLALYANIGSNFCLSPGDCEDITVIGYGLAMLLSEYNFDADITTFQAGKGYFYIEGRWTVNTVTNCKYRNVLTQINVYYNADGNIIQEVVRPLSLELTFDFFGAILTNPSNVCATPCDYTSSRAKEICESTLSPTMEPTMVTVSPTVMSKADTKHTLNLCILLFVIYLFIQ